MSHVVVRSYAVVHHRVKAERRARLARFKAGGFDCNRFPGVVCLCLVFAPVHAPVADTVLCATTRGRAALQRGNAVLAVAQVVAETASQNCHV